MSSKPFIDSIISLSDASLANAIHAFSESPVFLRIEKHSPFLLQLIKRYPDFLGHICQDDTEKQADMLMELLHTPPTNFAGQAALMAHLRHIKAKGALLAAIADMSGWWKLEQVTYFLSELAAGAVQLALDYLLLDAKKRGELPDIDEENPSKGSGLFILGMGKLGGFELNYSSDIDLIVFFDSQAQRYEGKQSLQHCMSRITRELVTIMQERTGDGYVFRTDIRLRPDPSSTPPALSINAAMTYYETVGQNWERAALIKARAIAGDLQTAEQFQQMILPFIWRRNLDFAAIQDIHSIKRQIDHRTGGTIKLAGHNVKLGAGGIREIEFFVQVQQLIWGGRNPELRGRNTCEMLYKLAAAGIVEAGTAKELAESYYFLRTLEHRLQMRRDQQTHSLPEQPEELQAVAEFSGLKDIEALEDVTLKHLRRVKNHYAHLFGVEQSLGSDKGSLVFTGVEPDPETMQTLERMGFQQVSTICEIIMNWHRGHRRATRNKQAREKLTEITPALLEALASSLHPDAAFHKFDEFLVKLPSGIQIFSLFAAKPDMLKLVASIMGSAPRLAEILSRTPSLFDAVLTGAFYDPLPDKTSLHAELDKWLEWRTGQDDFINIMGQFQNEKMFQAGIQLMHGLITPAAAGHYLSDLAEIITCQVKAQVEAEFAESYGIIENGELAILALGKLGAQDMSFTSDLDLIFVYDVPSQEALSNGEKSFTASVYYNRLAQRIIGLLTSLNHQGRLYNVDARLRPLGSTGALAAGLEAFDQYYHESAWTFEFMALTRGRVISASAPLTQKLEAHIARHLAFPRTHSTLKHDAAIMRKKVDAEFGSKNPWNLKHVRGGLMDMDFMSQYLMLAHGAVHPQIFAADTRAGFARLAEAGILDSSLADKMIAHYQLQSSLQHLLRLCGEGVLNEEFAPEGLKTLLYERLEYDDFNILKTALLNAQIEVMLSYQTILG